MKYLIFILLSSVGSFAHGENKSSGKLCLEDHCYINNSLGPEESELTDYYLKLVENINLDPSGMVYFTDEVKKHSRGDPLDRFIHHFKWVKNESLVEIVIGKEYSALLLEKCKDDRRVLYFNHAVNMYEIGYDSPEQYKPIDKLWVNGTSELKIY